MEIWKPIKSYQGRYEVSSLGNVRSLNFNKTGVSKILKPISNTRGYTSVCLCLNNEKSIFRINRLVAEAFIPNPENKPQVNHKDENKTNNKVENLEWSTPKENANHGTRSLRIAKKQSKKVIQMDMHGNYLKTHVSATSLKSFGYSQGTISMVCRGEREFAYGYKWKYV